jgi:hypothetical protein
MLRRSPPNRTELNAKAQRRKGAKSALRSSEAAWRGRCPRRIGSKHHRSASASMVGFKSLLVPLRGTPASGRHPKFQTPHLFERAPARKRRPTAQSVTSLAIRSETGGPRSGPGGTAIRGARCLCRASGAPLHPSGCTPLEPVSLASNPPLRLCVFAPLRFVLPLTHKTQVLATLPNSSHFGNSIPPLANSAETASVVQGQKLRQHSALGSEMAMRSDHEHGRDCNKDPKSHVRPASRRERALRSSEMLRRSPPNRTELNAKAQRRKGAKLVLRSSEAAWRGRCPRRIDSKHHRSASASMVGFKSLLVPLRGTPASGRHPKFQTPHLFERAPARKRRPTAQSVTSLAIRSETGGPRSGPGGTAIRGARCLCRASGAPLHPSGCTPLEPVSLASNPPLRLCVFAPLRFVLSLTHETRTHIIQRAEPLSVFQTHLFREPPPLAPLRFCIPPRTRIQFIGDE